MTRRALDTGRPPLVSVLLNSYNQAAFLESAIQSALGQTYTHLELIITENGSSDESQAIVKRYARQDSRIRAVLCSENESVSRRFNEAVRLARGKYVTFLYSDDLFLPEKLQRQVAALERCGDSYGVIYGPAYSETQATGVRVLRQCPVATGDVFADLLSDRCHIDMVTPLIRTAALRDHEFDESVFAEGEGIFLRLALTCRFARLDEPLVVLRDHGANRGRAILSNRDIVEGSARRLLREAELPLGGERMVRRWQARLMASYAWQGARCGAPRGWVWGCIARALRLDPILIVRPKLAASGALASMPRRIARTVNRLASRVRGVPEPPSLVDGYGGAASW